MNESVAALKTGKCFKVKNVQKKNDGTEEIKQDGCMV